MIQIDQTCLATFAATETEIDEAVLDFRSVVTSPSDQDPALVSHGTHGALNPTFSATPTPSAATAASWAWHPRG
ncbi:hypothetical protein GQ600_3816 [Phytophthora cactorum]|nr:hypothetical protein GQ600_3816 [Phytophthora cactorum]